MTKYIGDRAISTVQTVTVSRGREVEETDIVKEDENIFFLGPEDATKVTIEFTLTENAHPDGLSVEDQRAVLKELPESPVQDNFFRLHGKVGYMSVENVDVPESGSESTIVSGSIEGTFLPWPKNNPTNLPGGSSVVLRGSISDLSLTLTGDLTAGTSSGSGDYGSSYGDDYGN